MANKRKRKKHTKLILLIELVLILIAIAVGIIVLLYSKINKPDWDDGKVYTNELNDDNMSRYINIALLEWIPGQMILPKTPEVIQ